MKRPYENVAGRAPPERRERADVRESVRYATADLGSELHVSDARHQRFSFCIVDFEDLQQARELKDLAGGTIQSNQDEA